VHPPRPRWPLPPLRRTRRDQRHHRATSIASSDTESLRNYHNLQKGYKRTYSPLSALDREPLSAWANRIDAIPVHVQKAREAAAKLIEPKSVRVTPPAATLRTAEEVDQYIERLRSVLSAAVGKHGSLII
jgi:hypothetical protein